jgi:hypothetical protein
MILEKKTKDIEREPCVCITVWNPVIFVASAFVIVGLAAMCADVTAQKQQTTVRTYPKLRARH